MTNTLRQQITYLTQRGEDLEEIVVALGKQLKAMGKSPVLPLLSGHGVMSDRYINDITAGDFYFDMMSRWED